MAMPGLPGVHDAIPGPARCSVAARHRIAGRHGRGADLPMIPALIEARLVPMVSIDPRPGRGPRAAARRHVGYRRVEHRTADGQAGRGRAAVGPWVGWSGRHVVAARLPDPRSRAVSRAGWRPLALAPVRRPSSGEYGPSSTCRPSGSLRAEGRRRACLRGRANARRLRQPAGQPRLAAGPVAEGGSRASRRPVARRRWRERERCVRGARSQGPAARTG